jgi:hypothetical protein
MLGCVGLVLGLVLGACGFVGAAALRTDPDWSGGCAIGTGRDDVLHGSAVDPRVAWATWQEGGERVELIWPAGYRARFTPALEVLDADGRVVARAGDLIIGACMARPGDGDAIQVDADEVRPPGWQPGDG